MEIGIKMMMKYWSTILRLLGAEHLYNTQVKIHGNILNKVIMLTYYHIIFQ